MQVPLEYAMGTVRFSVGRATTADEIDTAVEDRRRGGRAPDGDHTSDARVGQRGRARSG